MQIITVLLLALFGIASFAFGIGGVIMLVTASTSVRTPEAAQLAMVKLLQAIGFILAALFCGISASATAAIAALVR